MNIYLHYERTGVFDWSQAVQRSTKYHQKPGTVKEKEENDKKIFFIDPKGETT